MKLLLLLFAATAVWAKSLPPNFHKCNRNRKDLKTCVYEAAQNGIGQLTKPYLDVNIPNINPIEISSVLIGAGGGAVGVDQKFTNVRLSGLHRIKLDKFEFDFGKKTLEASGVFPELVLKAEYELDGKILLLPIRGHGPGTIILRHLKVHVLFKYEEYTKKGKTYLKFVSSDLSLDPDNMHFNFENLFDGERALGDNINKVLNENWKEVWEDVKPGYVQLVNRILLNLFNNFFSKVSLEEAFD